MHTMLRRFGFTYMDGDAGGGAGQGATGTPPAPAPTGTPPPAPTPPAPTPPPAPAPFAGTEQWTPEQQKRVADIATAEKNAGKRAAEAAVQQALGCTPEEAKKIIDDKKAADLAALSETDRAKAEATADRARAAQELANAGLVSLGAQINSALVSAGIVDPDPVKQAKRLADLGMLVRVPPTTPVEELPAAITAAVTQLKTDYPAMFTTTAGAPGAPSHGAAGPGGGPAGPPAGGQPGADALARGAERAKQMNPGAGAANAPYNPNPFAAPPAQ